MTEDIDFGSVKFSSENHIGRVIVNRPEALNALNFDVLNSLNLLFEGKIIDQDKDLRVVIITGAGEKAFVAGADISEMASLEYSRFADYVATGQRLMRSIENFHAPVIASVNGFALGGGLELALACDLIIASSKSKLGTPEVGLGLIPGFGGTQRLISRCGVGSARRLVYTGDMISVDEAHRLGIVDIIANEGKLEEEVVKLAANICKKGPLAVQKAKQVLRQSEEARLLSGLSLEEEGFLSLHKTKDCKEGMAAFLGKRTPNFIGK